MPEEKIRLGISACLLGEKVRFDGGHKLDRFLTETLGSKLATVSPSYYDLRSILI